MFLTHPAVRYALQVYTIFVHRYTYLNSLFILYLCGKAPTLLILVITCRHLLTLRIQNKKTTDSIHIECVLSLFYLCVNMYIIFGNNYHHCLLITKRHKQFFVFAT